MPTGAFDLLTAPIQHLGFDPRHRLCSEFHLFRESLADCHAVNGGCTEASESFHFPQADEFDWLLIGYIAHRFLHISNV